jgi:hypothetical protein
MRLFMGAAKAYACEGFIVHPGPDLAGFSGAGEGVRTCSADSIASKILGLRRRGSLTHAAPALRQPPFPTRPTARTSRILASIHPARVSSGPLAPRALAPAPSPHVA